MSKKESNIIKYPKHFSVNIGYVIILIMFIYVAFHVFSFVTKKPITIYEVTNGTISSNREFNALAIREEEVISAEGEGTIIYLASNFDKVGVKTQLYAIDSTGAITNGMTYTALSDSYFDQKSISRISNIISDFMLDYNPSHFNRVYTIKTDLATQIDQMYAQGAMKAMSEQISSAIANGSFNIVYGKKPGIIVYSTDGYEGLKIKELKPENFILSNAVNTNYTSKSKVFNGQTVAKLITSDNWSLLIELDDELKEEMAEDEYVHIQFLSDEISTWCTCYEREIKDKTYLVIGLDDGVERYADSRFVHIKLLDRSVSGLKIPNSAIVSKEFYTIPKSYFYRGDDDGDLGIMVKSTNNNNFITPSIFYENDDYYYIDSATVNEGDVIMKPGSSTSTITVGSRKDSLPGVYNVNKGYAIFKHIDIKYQNADYSVIQSGTKYGVALYDHIVLQGDSVKEDQLLN